MKAIQINHKMKSINKLMYALLFMVSISGYGQFNDKGYKDLNVGMSYLEAEKIIPIDLAEDDTVMVNYDNIELELNFAYDSNGNYYLYIIRCTHKDVKLEGVSQKVMGKTLSEVKAVLGDKLAPYEDGGPESRYRIYYKDSAAKTNYESSCVLVFDQSGVLTSILTSCNP